MAAKVKKGDNNMRSGAMVLGLMGGVIGLIVGLMFLTETEWAFFICVFAIFGLVGGAITKGKPVPAGVLMLLGGIGGFVSGRFSALPGYLFFKSLLIIAVPQILLLIGGILSLVSRKQTT